MSWVETEACDVNHIFLCKTEGCLNKSHYNEGSLDMPMGEDDEVRFSITDLLEVGEPMCEECDEILEYQRTEVLEGLEDF